MLSPRTFVTTKVDNTKEFAKKHQTTIACTATAVVTASVTVIVTRKIDTRIMNKMLHEAGRSQVVQSLQTGVLLAYINDKDLGDDVREYLKSLVINAQ